MKKPNIFLLIGAITLTTFLITDQALSQQSPPGNIRGQENKAIHKPDFPNINLPEKAFGQAAIDALGDKLPEVAAWYGMTPLELREEMLKDKDLWVDENGRLLYTDTHLPENIDIIDGDSDDIQDAPLPLDQTFLLHSTPNATKTIYLDFTGHTTSGTYWNSSFNSGDDIYTPPYDFDGDNSYFSNDELTRIQLIWQRVVEDFASFDVDVTTEEPPVDNLIYSGSGDQHYGIRVVIGPNTFYGSAGGVAYVGSFSWSSDTPTFVFSDALANGHEKYTAEAASHEIGHTVGLRHDGTSSSAYFRGHGNWAPIMGAGYYEPIVQFSKGEYADANNSEDDFVIMQNHMDLYPDDHSNAASDATQLGHVDSVINGKGIIETNNDVDYFFFNTTGGAVSINISPDSRSGNLDIKATLRDGFGNVVLSADPAGLAASLNTTLGSGTYYLSIEGVGTGDPATNGYSDYASVGQYYISGSVPQGVTLHPPTAVMSVTPASGFTPLTVSFDASASSDQDGSVVSYLWDFGDGSSSTAINGSKTFDISGNYTVTLTVTDNDGLTNSKTTTVVAENNAPVAVIDATPLSGTAPLVVSFDGSGSYDNDGSISSYAWNFGDTTNGNGMTLDHTYMNAGNYTATLTVTDNKGATASSTITISVDADPNALIAPSGLNGGYYSNQVELYWTDNSSNETHFVVERSPKPKGKIKETSYTVIGTSSADWPRYNDPAPDGTYLYRVKAVNSVTGIESDYSNEVEVSAGGGGGNGGNKGGGNDGGGKPDHAKK